MKLTPFQGKMGSWIGFLVFHVSCVERQIYAKKEQAEACSQLVEKVFSTSCLRFQNFQKVLKSIDLNGAGHPSWVHLRAKSRATPGCAPKRPAGQPRTPFLPVFLHFRVFRQPGLFFPYSIASKDSAIWPSRAPKPSAASMGYSYSTAYIWLPEG